MQKAHRLLKRKTRFLILMVANAGLWHSRSSFALRLKSINFDFKILDLKFRILSCLEFTIFKILFHRVFLAFYFTRETFAAPDRAACDVKAIAPKLLPACG